MRKTAQLALLGSLLVAAAVAPPAGDGQPVALVPSAQAAGDDANIVPLPVYEAQAHSRQAVHVWSI